MKVFLDTEFSDLIRPKIIAIGMVSESSSEFYAELDGSHPNVIHAADFVQDIVLPQFGLLPASFTTVDQMGEAALVWLNSFGDEVEVVFDYKDDWELLIGAMGAESKKAGNAKLVPNLFWGGFMRTEEVLDAKERVFRQQFRSRGIEQHHALADALALREAWFLVEREGLRG